MKLFAVWVLQPLQPAQPGKKKNIIWPSGQTHEEKAKTNLDPFGVVIDVPNKDFHHI